MFALRANRVFYFLIAVVMILGWCYQGRFYYDSDNSILLHEAARLWQGGTYAGQFFETSPPMILYLYLPVVLLSKVLSLPLYILFRAYLFLITSVCVAFCYGLCDVLFQKNDEFIKKLFFLSLLAILLIFPNHELGQREDLYFVMSLPYCFLVARYLNGVPTNPRLRLVIGLLAGIAFSIKPFFIVTPVLLELWVMLTTRRWLACFRIETLTIFLTMLAYVLVSVVLNFDYYRVVIPYAMGTYYTGLAFSWLAMIFYPISVYCYLPIVLYALFYTQFKGYQRLITTLCVASLSFTLVYVIQRLPYYYHAVPGFLMAVSLFELLISMMVLKFKESQLDSWLLTAFITIYLFFTFCYRESLWGVLAISPMMPWLYYFTALTFLFCLYEKELTWWKWARSMAFSFGVTFLFTHLFSLAFPDYKNIFQTRLIVTFTVLFTVFMLTIRNPRFHKSTVLAISLLIALTFDYPVLIIATIYQRAVTYKVNTRPIVDFMNRYLANRSIYLFSSRGNTVFPLIDYAAVKVDSVSRFPFFWMMPGLVKQIHSNLRGPDEVTYLKNRDLLIDNIATDIEENKPDYVFVDVSIKKGNLRYPFEYLPYFIENAKFAKAWQSYEYMTRLDGRPLRFDYTYHIAVYRRH